MRKEQLSIVHVRQIFLEIQIPLVYIKNTKYTQQKEFNDLFFISPAITIFNPFESGESSPIHEVSLMWIQECMKKNRKKEGKLSSLTMGGGGKTSAAEDTWFDTIQLRNHSTTLAAQYIMYNSQFLKFLVSEFNNKLKEFKKAQADFTNMLKGLSLVQRENRAIS